MTEATYPSDQQPALRELMRPRDTNALGTIFGGVILSSIDLAGAIEAHAYHHGKVVTVAMDQIVFKQPVFVGDLVSYFTRTLRLGKTSITVGVSVWAQRSDAPEARVHVTEATVTFVAVDDQLRPTAVARSRAPRI